MIKKIIFILLIIFFILLFSNLFMENFNLHYEIDNNFNLKEYENLSSQNFNIYDTIDNLLNNNNNIKSDDKIIIYFVNGNSGFGSQLTIFMQNQYFFYELNPKIICIPYFSINSRYFKYHDSNYNNSFFLYFKKKEDIINLDEYKIYFIKSNVINNYSFFVDKIPYIENEINNKFIKLFIKNFKFIVNENIYNQINELKKNKLMIGIHIRSIAQKQCHHPEYISISIHDRLLNVHKKLQELNQEYIIFIATDITENIELAKSIFGNIYYFDNITRINNQDDIISVLSDDQAGYKLGYDILNECFGLSMCDKIYISSSNIPFIVYTMNPDINMESY